MYELKISNVENKVLGACKRSVLVYLLVMISVPRHTGVTLPGTLIYSKLGKINIFRKILIFEMFSSLSYSITYVVITWIILV